MKSWCGGPAKTLLFHRDCLLNEPTGSCVESLQSYLAVAACTPITWRTHQSFVTSLFQQSFTSNMHLLNCHSVEPEPLPYPNMTSRVRQVHELSHEPKSCLKMGEGLFMPVLNSSSSFEATQNSHTAPSKPSLPLYSNWKEALPPPWLPLLPT